MPGPIEYAAPSPPRRWSVAAVVAFVCSVLAPLIAGRVFAKDSATNPVAFAGSVIATAFATVLLCMIAFMFADIRRKPRRGRALAFAGVFISFGWIAGILLAFGLPDYFGPLLRLFV